MTERGSLEADVSRFSHVIRDTTELWSLSLRARMDLQVVACNNHITSQQSSAAWAGAVAPPPQSPRVRGSPGDTWHDAGPGWLPARDVTVETMAERDHGRPTRWGRSGSVDAGVTRGQAAQSRL